MTNADTMSAVLGLLLGLATRHPPVVVAAADASQLGPVVAIDKAKAAAGAEAARAQQHDNQAAQIFAPSSDAAQPSVPAAQPAAAPAPQAAQNPAPADQPAAPTDVASLGPNAAAADPETGTLQKYDPSAHRDPFRPPTMASVVADTGTPRTPLEGYEIGQLKLVGIVRNAAGVRAMVEDSQGLGYIVTSGTAIGSAGGIVRAIEERRVLIDETTTNFYGEKQAKEVVMELPQEDRSP